MRRDQVRRWLRCAGALALLVVGAGCHGAAPRDYPAFYDSWQELPAGLRSAADGARAAATEVQRASDHLLEYARLAALITRHQADHWLAVATDGASPRDVPDRQTRARLRVSEGCRHALALFQEYRLERGPLPWRDRIEVTWLLLLAGYDDDARDLVAATLSDPAVPDGTRAALEEIRSVIRDLPLERASSPGSPSREALP